MFKQLKIKKVFSTFENNGWEKMLLLAKQSLSSKALIIAHQHVPIAPSALNYYLTNQDLSILPDKIVTIGNVLKLFLKDLGYPEDKLVAVGNDDGYEHIFTKQLQNFAKPNDVLVAISASGNSPNIIHAVEFAKSRDLKVIGLTGSDGGKLREMSDIRIHVEMRKGEYGPVEDVHMFVDHLIGTYFNRVAKV